MQSVLNQQYSQLTTRDWVNQMLQAKELNEACKQYQSEILDTYRNAPKMEGDFWKDINKVCKRFEQYTIHFRDSKCDNFILSIEDNLEYGIPSSICKGIIKESEFVQQLLEFVIENNISKYCTGVDYNERTRSLQQYEESIISKYGDNPRYYDCDYY